MGAPNHPIPRSQCVDIGHGRGDLMPNPAASLKRLDSALGRPWDINEAWRDPAKADQNYANYLRDPARFPIALNGQNSIHCRGYAIDTDDNSGSCLELLHEHGWKHTVYRNGVLVEQWHLEYDEARDEHRGENPQDHEEDDVAFILIESLPARGRALIGPGYFRRLANAEQLAAGARMAGKTIKCSPREFDVIKALSLQGTTADDNEADRILDALGEE